MITVASSQGQAILQMWQPLTQQYSVTYQTQILSKSATRTSDLMLYIFRASILHRKI
jgi:hypothetical protein